MLHTDRVTRVSENVRDIAQEARSMLDNGTVQPTTQMIYSLAREVEKLCAAVLAMDTALRQAAEVYPEILAAPTNGNMKEIQL